MEILKKRHVIYLSLCMLSLWFGIVIYTAFANLDVEDAVYFSHHPLIAVEELLRGWKDTSEDLANQFDEEVKQQLSQQFYDSLHKETMEHIESLNSFKPTPKHDTFAEEKKKNEVLRNWLNEKTKKQITEVSILRKKKEKEIKFIGKNKWKHKNIKRKETLSKSWPTQQVVNFTLKLNFETTTNSTSIIFSKAAVNATSNLIRAPRNNKSATATTNRKIQENLHTSTFSLYSLTKTERYGIDNEKKDLNGYRKGDHTENTLEPVTSKEQIEDEKGDGSKEEKSHNKITYSNDEVTEMNIDTGEVKDDENSKTTPFEDDLDSKTEEEKIENEETSKNKEEKENTNNYEENTSDITNMNIHEDKENAEEEIEKKLKDKKAFVENLDSNQNDEELNLNNEDPGIDERDFV